MLSFLMHSRTVWNDFFHSSNFNYNSQTYSSRRTHSGTGLYISNCLFRSITSSSNGGALYYSDSGTYFLIESTSFFSCKTSASYGAIYIYISNGQSVLHKVCGFNCSTTNSNSYQFAYIYVYNNALYKNYVSYSSVASCVAQQSNAHYTLYLDWGNIYFPSVNMSLNKCYHRTVYCLPSGDSNSFTCSFTYCSFADNTLTGYTCIYLNIGGIYHKIKSCNIIRNTQSSLSTQGTIYTSGNLAIYDSCILENIADRIFYEASSSYYITLSNCTVDKTIYYQNLITPKTVTKSFILALKHISTQYCYAKYDEAGTLTPIIQTCAMQMRCYTRERFFIQHRLGDMVLLTNIFIQLYSPGSF
jgi:hypothetical protein